MFGDKHTDEIAILEGTLIGEKYRVVRRLGVGGMGAVYEAVNTWTLRRVAVKVLLPAASARPDLELRFKREAQSESSLRHPNIVEVLDMGRDRSTGLLYMVQEFLDGIDLHDYMGMHGPFLARDAFEILIPLMGALIVAHEKGILHRDIKPENVFLQKGKGGERVPKLIDFGVAKIVKGPTTSRQTDSGQVVGTIHYMSPEQATASPDIDARSDVWALGVMLYEMLTGVLPFDAENANVLMVKVMRGAMTPLTTLAPDLPASVCAIVEGALTVDPVERFQSVREMLDAVLASELFANDPPERSVALRHQRSLPTFAAQLKPAAMVEVVHLPKAALLPADLLAMAPAAPDAELSIALDETRPQMRVMPLPAQIAPSEKPAPRRSPLPAARSRTPQSPRVHVPRRVLRSDPRLTEQTLLRAVKMAAAVFALVSLASFAVVWHGMQQIGGDRLRLNAAIARIESTPATPATQGAPAVQATAQR